MAGTKGNRTVILEGPIFDADVIGNLRRELGKGIQELGEEGEGILMGFISSKGFENTGAFLRSVTSAIALHNPAVYPDASMIEVTDDWAHHGKGRPTKTWFEEGKRNGVRLRKGRWGFKNTATRLKAMDYDKFFSDRIAKVLG